MFRSLPRRALLWAALPAVLLTGNAHAAATGEHRKQIPIESWSFGSTHGSGGGGGAGKVHYSDLSVMISLEKASPLLDLAVAEGGHVDAVELSIRAPAAAPGRGGDQQDYLTVTLEDVLVSSYQTSAGQNIRLSLNFTRISFGSIPASGPGGTGKTMAAEVLASALGRAGGANFALADGSVRFLA